MQRLGQKRTGQRALSPGPCPQGTGPTTSTDDPLGNRPPGAGYPPLQGIEKSLRGLPDRTIRAAAGEGAGQRVARPGGGHGPVQADEVPSLAAVTDGVVCEVTVEDLSHVLAN